MKTLFKIIAWTLGVLIVVVLAAVAVILFVPGVQRTLVLYGLHQVPGTEAEVEKVHIGWNQVTMSQVTVRKDGLVLHFDDLQADVDYQAALNQQFIIHKLHLNGVEADLRQLPEFLENLPETEEPETEAEPFRGVFELLKNAPAVTIDDLQIDGVAMLPEGRTFRIDVDGGGIAPQQEGKIVLKANLQDGSRQAAVEEITLQSDITIGQSADSYVRFALTSEASAKGGQLPRQARIQADANLEKIESGERYAVTLVNPERPDTPLAQLNGTFFSESRLVGLDYSLNMVSGDIAPYLPGMHVPDASIRGQGDGEVSLDTMEGRFSGNLMASGEEFGLPETVAPGLRAGSLSSLFEFRSDGETFALNLKEFTVSINRQLALSATANVEGQLGEAGLTEATISASEEIQFLPVLRAFLPPSAANQIRSLVRERPVYDGTLTARYSGNQVTVEELSAIIETRNQGELLRFALAKNLTYDLGQKMGGLMSGSREILTFQLSDLPVALMSPFLPGIDITGGTLGGLTTVSVEDGAILLRSDESIALDGLNVEQNGQALVNGLKLRLTPQARYQGDQVQGRIDLLVLGDGTGEIVGGTMSADLKLSESGLPTGTARADLGVDLPSLYTLPVLAKTGNIDSGRVSVNANAKLGETVDFTVETTLANVHPKGGEDTIEQLKSTVEGTYKPETGELSAQLPVVLQGPKGTSELQTDATLTPGEPFTFQVSISGEKIFADDFQYLASAFAPSAEKSGEERQPAPQKPNDSPRPTGPDSEPLWAGFEGSASLDIAAVQYQQYLLEDIQGSVRVDEHAITLRGIRAILADEPIKLDATVRFRRDMKEPYTLGGRMDLDNFDAGKFFRQVDSESEPPVEGLFSLKARLAGNGPNLQTVADWAQGTLKFESSNGLFRPMPDSTIGKTAKTVSQLGELASILGVGGGRTTADIRAAARAISYLAEVEYNSFVINAERGEDLNLNLNKIDILNQELHIFGNGKVTHQPGVPLMDQPLSAKLDIAGKGRGAEVFQEIGFLSTKQDDLGYTMTTESFRASGSLSDPKTNLQEVLSKVGKTAYQNLSGEGNRQNKSRDDAPSETEQAVRGLLDLLNQ